ncbi:MAG: cytochrome c oxidase subunit II [Hydrogenophaga sp.]|uniref:cytochrome c oxidase subunit II n=1 Tax=Hydrogenophaga sp. TaxID=1904254 RepID=UPI002AB833A0|nr:cytochrome c oxidase subunit II [Hydrogenophaga sp.]MDZ4281726.1 cytochrome c oxidase subunit II [Hydrogenophaga sp.]
MGPVARAWLLVMACVVLTGCSGAQSMLDPAGPSALAIAQVWWWMLGVATVVTLGVVAAWWLAMRRRRHSDDAVSDAMATRDGLRWMVGGGIVLPTLAITALLIFGTPAGMHQLPLPLTGGAEPLRINVQARQWAWMLHYPGSGVRLQNELRLPVGRAVDIHVGSEDVIHSFWVPRLGGKIDAIPGRTNIIRLQADQAGRFRGQCAEFCGLNHAHMVMTVIAMPVAEFETWQAAARGAAHD